jgi:hypothetical protein
MYRYYVAFSYLDNRGLLTMAAKEIILELPVRTMNDVNVIKDILTTAGYPNPLVLSFSRFTPQTTPTVKPPAPQRAS